MKKILYIMIILLFCHLSVFALDDPWWVDLESLDNKKAKLDTSSLEFQGNNIYFSVINNEDSKFYYVHKMVINTKNKQAGVLSTNKIEKLKNTIKLCNEKKISNTKMYDINYGSIQEAIYDYLIDNTLGDIRRIPKRQRLAYLTSVQELFFKNWNPKLKETFWYEPVKIKFTINRNGNIVKYEVQTKNADANLVKSIVKAIKKINKFPALPPYTDAKALTSFYINFMFDVSSSTPSQIIDKGADGMPYIFVVKHKSEKTYKSKKNF